MSFTNSTPNYHLPQYVQSDKPAYLSDFNNAMDTIDTAMHDNSVNTSQGSADLQVAINQLNETKQQVDDAIGQINQLKTQTEALQEQATQVTQNATDALNDATEAKTNSTQATTIASQASSTANSALSTANSNYTEIQSLDDRVTALEDNPKGGYWSTTGTSGITGAGVNLNATVPEEYRKYFNSNSIPIFGYTRINGSTTAAVSSLAGSSTTPTYDATTGTISVKIAIEPPNLQGSWSCSYFLGIANRIS